MTKDKMTIKPTEHELKLAGDILEYGIANIPCQSPNQHIVFRGYCKDSYCRKMFLAQCFASYRAWLDSVGVE